MEGWRVVSRPDETSPMPSVGAGCSRLFVRSRSLSKQFAEKHARRFPTVVKHSREKGRERERGGGVIQTRAITIDGVVDQADVELEHARDIVQKLSGMDVDVCRMAGDGLCFFYCVVAAWVDRSDQDRDHVASKLYLPALGLLVKQTSLHPFAHQTAARMGRLKDRLQKVGITIGEDLSDVRWYILDKVLVLVGMPNVLNENHYAEEAEIIALLKAMNLNILVINIPFVGTGCILPEHRYLRSADLERACEDLGSFDTVLLYWGDSHYDFLKVTNATQGAQVRGFDLESEWAECKKDLRALASKAGVEQDQLRLLDVVQLELPEVTKLPEVGQEGEGAASQDINPTRGDSPDAPSSDEDDPKEECCPEEIEILKSKS